MYSALLITYIHYVHFVLLYFLIIYHCPNVYEQFTKRIAIKYTFLLKKMCLVTL